MLPFPNHPHHCVPTVKGSVVAQQYAESSKYKRKVVVQVWSTADIQIHKLCVPAAAVLVLLFSVVWNEPWKGSSCCWVMLCSLSDCMWPAASVSLSHLPSLSLNFRLCGYALRDYTSLWCFHLWLSPFSCLVYILWFGGGLNSVSQKHLPHDRISFVGTRSSLQTCWPAFQPCLCCRRRAEARGSLIPYVNTKPSFKS